MNGPLVQIVRVKLENVIMYCPYKGRRDFDNDNTKCRCVIQNSCIVFFQGNQKEQSQKVDMLHSLIDIATPLTHCSALKAS